MPENLRNELSLQMAKMCAGNEGASQSDIDDVFGNKPASTRGGKCLRACLLEAGQLVSRFLSTIC